jgi:hypothetical protein
MRLLITSIFLLASVTAHSASVTIDFEELAPTGSYPTIPGPIISQDFSFSTEDGFLITQLGGDPSQRLYYCPTCTLTMDNASGDDFRLTSLDFFAGGVDAGESITLTGYYAGGGTITTALINSGPTQTYLFGAEWDGLEQIVISAPDTLGFGTSVDNIVINGAPIVPIPAAVWLFGSGLGLLGWFRRKKA